MFTHRLDIAMPFLPGSAFMQPIKPRCTDQNKPNRATSVIKDIIILLWCDSTLIYSLSLTHMELDPSSMLGQEVAGEMSVLSRNQNDPSSSSLSFFLFCFVFLLLYFILIKKKNGFLKIGVLACRDNTLKSQCLVLRNVFYIRYGEILNQRNFLFRTHKNTTLLCSVTCFLRNVSCLFPTNQSHTVK